MMYMGFWCILGNKLKIFIGECVIEEKEEDEYFELHEEDGKLYDLDL